MSSQTEEQQGSSAAKPTLGQRLKSLLGWCFANWIRTAMVGTAGLASIGAVVVLWLTLAGSHHKPPEKITAADVQNALDHGRLSEAKRLATTLQQQGNLPPELWGLVSYAQGVAAFEAAEQSLSESKKDRYLAVARLLEQARERGFPPGHENKGLLLLGKSLYGSGQYVASRPVLQEALPGNPESKTEIHSLLAGACLNAPNPLLKDALKENDIVLTDTKLLPDMRREALLQRAQILLRSQKPDEAAETLARLPQAAERRADVRTMQAWVLMEQARAIQSGNDPNAGREAQEKYQAALKSLRVAVKQDSLSTETRAQAMYLIGVCQQRSGDAHGALEQFSRIVGDYAGSPEALAAGFDAAEMYRLTGQQTEAMAGYRRVLTSVKSADTYSNPWIPLDTLRQKIIEVYQYYFDQQAYKTALQLAAAMMSIIPEARAVTLKAEAYQAWGRKVLDEISSQPASRAEQARHEGRRLLRLAGLAYGRLAQIHFLDRQYTSDVWASGENLLAGQDFRGAAAAFREYLKNETRHRYALGLVYLGDSLLSMGRIDDALEAFSECINFYSRDVSSYRARLLASLAFLEKNNRKEARRLLEENLGGEVLTPSSEEWRDSLFALGRLLHGEKQYSEASIRLEEAVARYPDCPQSIEARYLVAESYRLRALQMREQLEKDAAQSVREAHTRQVIQLFETALGQYEQTEAELAKRQRVQELNPLEKAIHRNCAFAIGAVLFDLERYDAAVKAYAVACNRYQNSPEVLEAYLQLARAYRRLDKLNEAHSALDQAKVALSRMKEGDQFTEATNYNKQRWGEVLDWMANSLDVEAKQERPKKQGG